MAEVSVAAGDGQGQRVRRLRSGRGRGRGREAAGSAVPAPVQAAQEDPVAEAPVSKPRREQQGTTSGRPRHRAPQKERVGMSETVVEALTLEADQRPRGGLPRPRPPPASRAAEGVDGAAAPAQRRRTRGGRGGSGQDAAVSVYTSNGRVLLPPRPAPSAPLAPPPAPRPSPARLLLGPQAEARPLPLPRGIPDNFPRFLVTTATSCVWQETVGSAAEGGAQAEEDFEEEEEKGGYAPQYAQSERREPVVRAPPPPRTQPPPPPALSREDATASLLAAMDLDAAAHTRAYEAQHIPVKGGAGGGAGGGPRIGRGEQLPFVLQPNAVMATPPRGYAPMPQLPISPFMPTPPQQGGGYGLPPQLFPQHFPYPTQPEWAPYGGPGQYAGGQFGQQAYTGGSYGYGQTGYGQLFVPGGGFAQQGYAGPGWDYSQ